jgi:hypothetical protein
MKRNNVSQPSFQGVGMLSEGLNDLAAEIVLQRLAKANDEVFEVFSAKKFKEVMTSLIERYECLGTSSCGIHIVGNNDLPKLLGKDAPLKYDLNGKTGFCVVVGNKRGPVNEMTNIYQAKTFLLKDSDMPDFAMSLREVCR